jgi:hypothetical protein
MSDVPTACPAWRETPTATPDRVIYLQVSLPVATPAEADDDLRKGLNPYEWHRLSRPAEGDDE